MTPEEFLTWTSQVAQLRLLELRLDVLGWEDDPLRGHYAAQLDLQRERMPPEGELLMAVAELAAEGLIACKIEEHGLGRAGLRISKVVYTSGSLIGGLEVLHLRANVRPLEHWHQVLQWLRNIGLEVPAPAPASTPERVGNAGA